MAGSPKNAKMLVQSEVHGAAVPVRMRLAWASAAHAAAPAGVDGFGTNEVPENFPTALRLVGLMLVNAIVPVSTEFPETRFSFSSMTRLNVPETGAVPSVPAIAPLTPLFVQLMVALS
jgi:hypothetical protein